MTLAEELQDIADTVFEVAGAPVARPLWEIRDKVAELENEAAKGVHTCHADCPRPMCVLTRENAALKTMTLYTCNTFHGHYPVGSAAVVRAENAGVAADMLNQVLVANGLPGNVKAEQMVRLPEGPQVKILCDGNY